MGEAQVIHVANITAPMDCPATATGEHLFDYEGVEGDHPHFWCKQCGRVYSVDTNSYGDLSLVHKHPLQTNHDEDE